MAYLDLEDIKKHWKLATEGLANFRTEARESYDFAASHQWSAEDTAKLEDEERPAVTFDRVGVFIDAVSGMEINNRQAIKYFPVEKGDVRLNDTLTQAVKYYENDCGAEDEDSEAVRDAVICGIGVTETIMEHERHPEGAPCVQRRDPLHCWFDPEASRRNLVDARFVFYGDWIPLEEAKERWPKGNFSGEMPSGVENSTSHVADRAFLYEESGERNDAREGQVFVLQYQCWKHETIYRLTDPQTGSLIDFTQNKFAAAKKLFEDGYGREPVEGTDYVKTRRKAFYRAFLSGDDILEEERLPLKQFTFNFITYKRDRNKRVWYGLVRTMKDPQRWANKWLSQVLHIVNANAKGGAFVETGALADPRKAEEQWATPSPLILLKEGGIDKIRERTASPYPSGLDRLMQFAFNALPMVSGLNLEVLGLADRDQAGVLEAQRRQSAYQILAPLFASVREYRRSRGRLMLEFLRFIPKGTLVRVVGERGEQWVPLVYEDHVYDVKVDQAPDSPDYKQQVWEAMAQILPAMMKAGYPIPPEVLEYSPLPPDVAQEWVQWIKQQGWIPPEMRQQFEQISQQLQKLSEQNMKLKEENVMLRLDHSLEQGKLALKAKEGEDKNSVKVFQTQAEVLMARMAQEMESQRNAMTQFLKAQKDEIDARLRAAEQVTAERTANAKAQIDAFKALVDASEVKMKEKEVELKAKELEFKKTEKKRIRRVKDGEYEIG